MRIPNLDSGNPIVFSNANNLTWGTNGDTITASVSIPAAALVSISAAGGNASGPTIVLSNANNVTFGLSVDGAGGTITASAGGGGGPAGLAAGSQTATSGTAVFSNANGFTFGMSGSSRITASYGGPILSFWANPVYATTICGTNPVTNLITVGPVNLGGPFPGLMTASTMGFMLQGSGVVTSRSGTLSLSIGFYTNNAGTLSIINSASTSFSWSNVSNNTTAFSGLRWITFNSSQWSSTPTFSMTDYWVAIQANTGGSTQDFRLAGMSIVENTIGGLNNVDFANGTLGGTGSTRLPQSPFLGAVSRANSTLTLPASIASSNMTMSVGTIDILPGVFMDCAFGSF